MKKLLVVDGNSIMNRAFYGVRPLTTATGLNTNAIYGYLNILKKHLDGIKPDFAAVAFDLKKPTFRHNEYADYKAGRHKMPDELAEQIPYIKKVTELLGISVLSKEGFEADDILGTLSHKFEEYGESYVLTGDRDSFQLVSDKTTVILASTGKDEIYTPDKIMEKYTLTPKALIEVKALMGDASDNIPGVPGVGEKTAIKYIAEAGTVENLYNMIDEDRIKLSDSQKMKLLEGRESAKMSRFLAEIVLDIPDFVSPVELPLGEMKKDELRELFAELEFTKLQEKFGLNGETTQDKNVTCDNMQMSFDSVPVEETKEITLDEIKDKLLYCDFEGDSFYVYRDGARKLTLNADILQRMYDDGIRLVMWDSRALWHYSLDSGTDLPEDFVKFDLSLASYSLYPDGKGEFSRTLVRFLKISADSSLSALASYRVKYTQKLYEELSKLIESEKIDEIYYNAELPLSRVLAKMEHEGFLVDRSGIEKYGVELRERLSRYESEIYDLAGEKFNINSPKQLGVILFEKLNLPILKKNKTGYSTDAETLEKLRIYHPIVDMILEYRSISKLVGTYVDGLIKVIAEDGKIHTSFKQTQTLTGRLSSAEPNLQNIPIRTEEGSKFRKFFIAEKGNVLVDADYSQIELRLLAHISGDENMIDAFKRGVDIHTATASKVFHIPESAVTDEMRKKAKAVNFGIVYGIGEFSLAGDLHVSMKEAKNYITSYFETYPGIKRYLDNVVKSAYENGYVTTMFGRKRFIPELTGTKKTLRSFGERVAMNTPIQGSAADIIKLAMVNVSRELEKRNLRAKLILQVHDELIVECPDSEKDEVLDILQTEMAGVVTTSVDLISEGGFGDSWFVAH